MPARKVGKTWIPFVVVNVLVTFFGLSYIFFPMGTVVQDGDHTTGILAVPRVVWGMYVVVSALALAFISVTAYRSGERWAWFVLLYQFVFLGVVAAVEPDYVVPGVFALVLALMLWRSRRQRLDQVGDFASTASTT